MLACLDRTRTVAGPGWSRWLVPPAALAVHLSIGQAYAFSVFNKPLTLLLGGDAPAPGDWPMTATIWTFNLAFFCLGLSAAVFGPWVERSGPRKTMAAAACCFAGGFLVAALGVAWHSLPLLLLGYGALGGVGLGLGYIAPVSTLLKWFPDRPGMATGLAIMGFGGGAMVGSPLALELMDAFRAPGDPGVWQTFVAMGAIYGALMAFGAVLVRVPPAGHLPHGAPAGAAPPALTPATASAPPAGLTAAEAIRTKAFWLVWVVLFVNVTAGIGLLGQASPMMQEVFAASPHAAAGFVGLISLFNLVGRFAWSSASDRVGRKTTYALYLGLGMALYALLPATAAWGARGVFVLACCVILSMYGGAFATVPAYLRDLFGTVQVGAIHGRLLTAWSLAAIAGPSAVTYVRERQLAAGVAPAAAYSLVLYALVALLAVGFVANALVPHRGPASGSAAAAPAASANARSSAAASPTQTPPPWHLLAATWGLVLAPLGWGVWMTATKAMGLFAGG
ncbi:MAG: OFA family MFS transporter [Planctomycetota bacterium]